MSSIDHLRSGQAVNITRANQNKTQDTSDKTTPDAHSSSEVSKANNKDAFSLSAESRALNSINHQMATESHFDNAKVEAIKTAIANGSYTVDPEKIAENMLKYADTFQQK